MKCTTDGDGRTKRAKSKQTDLTTLGPEGSLGLRIDTQCIRSCPLVPGAGGATEHEDCGAVHSKQRLLPLVKRGVGRFEGSRKTPGCD